MIKMGHHYIYIHILVCFILIIEKSGFGVITYIQKLGPLKAYGLIAWLPTFHLPCPMPHGFYTDVVSSVGASAYSALISPPIPM